MIVAVVAVSTCIVRNSRHGVVDEDEAEQQLREGIADGAKRRDLGHAFA
jgi:hypothetical protein